MSVEQTLQLLTKAGCRRRGTIRYKPLSVLLCLCKGFLELKSLSYKRQEWVFLTEAKAVSVQLENAYRQRASCAALKGSGSTDLMSITNQIIRYLKAFNHCSFLSGTLPTVPLHLHSFSKWEICSLLIHLWLHLQSWGLRGLLSMWPSSYNWKISLHSPVNT